MPPRGADLASPRALAPTIPVMLAGRAITGVGAACVLPNTLAIVVRTTPPERRASAIAIWASMTGAGGVVGNVGGGAILSAGLWRWLFAAVVPIALGCAAWVAAAVPSTGRHQRALRPGSAILLTLASLALLLGIISGPESGWASVPVIGGFVMAALLLPAWVVTELRTEHPMLDPRLFRIPRLRAACLGLLVAFFGMFGLFYVNASFLQYVKGFTVLQAGLGIVPMTLAMLFGGRFAGRLSQRASATATLAPAFVLIGGGLLGLSACGPGTPYVYWGLLLAVIGTGSTLALQRLSADIAASLPPEQAGIGGGLQATTREFGSALGVAIIGTIITGQFAASAHGLHNVPGALAAGLSQPAVRAAYAASASAGLRVMGLLTLAAGAVVTSQSYFSRPSTPDPVGSWPAGAARA